MTECLDRVDQLAGRHVDAVLAQPAGQLQDAFEHGPTVADIPGGMDSAIGA